MPGEKPTAKDWEDHLSTLFPEVRLKQFLEMRGTDMGDEAHVNALPALWVGLLYDDGVLDQAMQLVRDWTDAERQEQRDTVPRLALRTPFRGGTLAEIAEAVVDLAREGLVRRGLGEEVFLAPLEETLDLGKTPAERWLDKYNGEWAGDLTRIFEDAEI